MGRGQVFFLPLRSPQTALTIQNARLGRLLELVEEAAGQGCFSLEVPFGASLGSPSWWWDGRNQTTVGDYLAERGCHVKFRNPRIEGSQYPSLLVDWYDEDSVARLVNQHHAAKQPSKG